MNNTLRHIAGYIGGGFIFLILVPFGFYELSRLDYLNDHTILINTTPLKYSVCLLIFILGMLFVGWSNIFLFIIGKGGPADGFGITISPRSKNLVTTGPYRFTRNPMVFGALAVYLSLVIYMNSLFGLIAVILLFFAVRVYLKLSEEKRLLRDFGNDYAEYRKKVPMIIPLKFMWIRFKR